MAVIFIHLQYCHRRWMCVYLVYVLECVWSVGAINERLSNSHIDPMSWQNRNFKLFIVLLLRSVFFVPHYSAEWNFSAGKFTNSPCTKTLCQISCTVMSCEEQQHHHHHYHTHTHTKLIRIDEKLNTFLFGRFVKANGRAVVLQ